MFLRTAVRRCTRTLPTGVRLDGSFDPLSGHLVRGVATTPDGRVFKGVFDSKSGSPLDGTQLEEDGDLYRGGFNSQWQRSGSGESFLADGTHYRGTFENDELVNGQVSIPSATGDVVFNGELKDERFLCGTLAQSDFTYTGYFQNNAPHGKGKLQFSTGTLQEGTFFNGKLHGPDCKMQLESGHLYIGEFQDGMIKKGQLFTATYHYDGEFSEDGRANGEGTQTFLASSPKLIFTGIWADGTLVRGTCHDDSGNPVDWLDNHQLRTEVLGQKQAESDARSRSQIKSEHLIQPFSSFMANPERPNNAASFSDRLDMTAIDSDADIDRNKARSTLSEQVAFEDIISSQLKSQMDKFK